MTSHEQLGESEAPPSSVFPTIFTTFTTAHVRIVPPSFFSAAWPARSRQGVGSLPTSRVYPKPWWMMLLFFTARAIFFVLASCPALAPPRPMRPGSSPTRETWRRHHHYVGARKERRNLRGMISSSVKPPFFCVWARRSAAPTSRPAYICTRFISQRPYLDPPLLSCLTAGREIESSVCSGTKERPVHCPLTVTGPSQQANFPGRRPTSGVLSLR